MYDDGGEIVYFWDMCATLPTGAKSRKLASEDEFVIANSVQLKDVKEYINAYQKYIKLISKYDLFDADLSWDSSNSDEIEQFLKNAVKQGKKIDIKKALEEIEEQDITIGWWIEEHYESVNQFLGYKQPSEGYFEI